MTREEMFGPLLRGEVEEIRIPAGRYGSVKSAMASAHRWFRERGVSVTAGAAAGGDVVVAVADWNRAAKKHPYRNPNRECECGRLRSRHAPACKRCQYLDGGQLLPIIDAIRLAGEATVDSIAQDTGRSVRSVRHSLASLMRRNRVVRYFDSDEDGVAIFRLTYRYDDKEEAA